MKPIGSLSGGEAARLVFGRIIVEQPNVLVLDEPTNHLDLESIQALADSLKAYEGTLLFVSHDRWFVSEVATRIIELTPEGPRDFPGTFAEYLERSGDDHLDADKVVASAKAKAVKSKPAAGENKLSYEEQKKERNRIQGLPKLRDKLLLQIETAETRKKEIAALYDDPQFYMKTSHEKMDELVKELADLTKKIETWMSEWEAVEADIAANAAANT